MEPYATWKVITQLILIPVVVGYCWSRPSTLLRIIALCICAMVSYGMIQDQFSVRLSMEYFTIAHPSIEEVEDPTLLGLLWGFLGSWWGGLFIGISAGLTATAGSKPQLTWQQLVRPVGLLMLAIACGTLVAGASGYYNGTIVGIRLGSPFAEAVPEAEHLQFFAVACGHFGTYSTAMLGSIALCVWIAIQRNRLEQTHKNSENTPPRPIAS